MRRSCLLSLVLLAGTLAVPAGASAAQPPRPVALTDGWTLQMQGHQPRPVSVPGVFAADPVADVFGGQRGTYRLTFTPPALPAGFAWALRFGEVRRVARVTLNGTVLGTHRDPYVPFTLSAGSLRPGQPNTLEVAVDNHKGAEPREGWWNWGGITRPVSLVAQGPVVLRDAALLPDVRCAGGPDGGCTRASVHLDGWLANRSSATVRPSVDVTLRAPGRGTLAAQATVAAPALRPGEQRRIRATIPVRGRPELWAPGHPVRYPAKLLTRVGKDGPVAQVDAPKVGLRRVEVRDGRLVLNGRPVQLRGASIQEDVEGRGPALDAADMDHIVARLKALHANVTRAHYLLNPELLDRFDAAGILVWTQAPIYHRDVLLRTPGQRANALATLRGTVLAGRTHPSTLTFSVANELSSTPDDLPPTRAYLEAAQRTVRDLDPLVPVAVDTLSYPKTPKQGTYAGYDLLGLDSYFGWYTGKPERSVANLSGLEPFLRATHAQYPGKALVITEFGAEATEAGPVDRKQTYAFQSAYLRRTLGVLDRLDFVDGAIYWTLQEFAVKPKWDGGANRRDIEVDAIHNKGLIAYDGRPKPALAEARRLFARTPLYAPVPLTPARERPPRAAPQAGERGDPAGVPLFGGALLGLLALLIFDAWCLAGIRADRREQELGEVIALPSRRAA